VVAVAVCTPSRVAAHRDVMGAIVIVSLQQLLAVGLIRTDLDGPELAAVTHAAPAI
jgi:hypothetical protein